jgi:hypothetical protein
MLAGGLLCTFPSSADVSAASPSAKITLPTISLPKTPDPALAPILKPGSAGISSPAPVPVAVPDVDSSVPYTAPAPATYELDVYDPRAERWQEPDATACTATSTLSMLNTIFYSDSDPSLGWLPSTDFRMEESILAYERAHMTMSKLSAGSDPHGWRNALNYFGWGSINAGVYVDAAYGSFGAAAKAAVLALAQTRKPVGILAEYGRHAEFITGYKVTGADPATGSQDFTIIGVYFTDPHQVAGHRDAWVSYARWQTGVWRVQFSPYEQVDSPRRDKIDGHVGMNEWLGKWVIIEPVK